MNTFYKNLIKIIKNYKKIVLKNVEISTKNNNYHLNISLWLVL